MATININNVFTIAINRVHGIYNQLARLINRATITESSNSTQNMEEEEFQNDINHFSNNINEKLLLLGPHEQIYSEFKPSLRYCIRILPEHDQINGFEVSDNGKVGCVTYTQFDKVWKYYMCLNPYLEVRSTKHYELVTVNAVFTVHYFWFFDRKLRNKLKHAISGNTETNGLALLATVSQNTTNTTQLSVSRGQFEEITSTHPTPMIDTYLMRTILQPRSFQLSLYKDNKLIEVTCSGKFIGCSVRPFRMNNNLNELRTRGELLTNVNSITLFMDTYSMLEFSYKSVNFTFYRRFVSDNEYTWDLTARCRNKLAHIKNGNTKGKQRQKWVEKKATNESQSTKFPRSTPFKDYSNIDVRHLLLPNGNLNGEGEIQLLDSFKYIGSTSKLGIKRLEKQIADLIIANKKKYYNEEFYDEKLADHLCYIDKLWIKNNDYRNGVNADVINEMFDDGEEQKYDTHEDMVNANIAALKEAASNVIPVNLQDRNDSVDFVNEPPVKDLPWDFSGKSTFTPPIQIGKMNTTSNKKVLEPNASSTLGPIKQAQLNKPLGNTTVVNQTQNKTKQPSSSGIKKDLESLNKVTIPVQEQIPQQKSSVPVPLPDVKQQKSQVQISVTQPTVDTEPLPQTLPINTNQPILPDSIKVLVQNKNAHILASDVMMKEDVKPVNPGEEVIKLVHKPVVGDNIIKSYYRRIFCTTFVEDEKLTKDNIIVLDEPSPTRVIEGSLQQVAITKFYEANIVKIQNENLWTFLALKTPDFKTNAIGGGYFLYKCPDTVKIPQDYMVYANNWWQGRSMTAVNYRIFVEQTKKYASLITLQAGDLKNLVESGPIIGMHYDCHARVQRDSVTRDERYVLKWDHNVRRLRFLLQCVLSMLFSMVILSYFVDFIGGHSKELPVYVPKVPKLSNMEWITYWITPLTTVSDTYCSDLFNYNVNGYCMKNKIDCLLNFKKYDQRNSYTHMFIQMCDNFVYTYQGQEFYELEIIRHIHTNYIILTTMISHSLIYYICLMILHPIAIIGSPIVEEWTRSFKTTILLIFVERMYYGTFVTAYFHIAMFILTLFKVDEFVRVPMHMVYNMACLRYSLNPASSMLSMGLIVTNKILRRNNMCEWEKFYKKPLKDYYFKGGVLPPLRQKSIIRQVFEVKQSAVKHQYSVGMVNKGYMPVAFSSNLINEVAAVRGRLLKETPPPNKDVLDRFFIWFKANRSRIFPKTSKKKIESVSFDTYIENSNASPSVKAVLKKTYAQMVSEGYTENTKLSKSILKKWCTRKTFVKVENLLYETVAGIKDKTPRPIQGAQPQFICLVGPWIMSLQNSIKRDWNYNNFMCFTSGISTLKTAKLATKFNMWMEDDVSEWDASTCEELLKIEVWFYKKCGAPTGILQLLQTNVNTRGYTAHGLFYKRRGCRKSGDPYTSLGNSILNGLIHLFIFCEENNCTVNEARQRFTMLIQGDDNLMNMSGYERRINWKKRMLEFGYKAIAMYKHDRDKVEFCSMRLYAVKEGVVFGPMPGKVLAKLGVFCDPKMTENPYAMLRGTAMGLIPGCYHIPPLRVVIDRILELTKAIGQAFVKPINENWKMKFKPCTMTVDTWTSLNTIYSWDEWFNSAMESEYNKTTLGCTHVGPASEYIMDRDTSGPKLLLW